MFKDFPWFCPRCDKMKSESRWSPRGDFCRDCGNLLLRLRNKKLAGQV